MKTYKVNFADNYKCAMGECLNTCCHGWRILVDDETYGKYLRTSVIDAFGFWINIKEVEGAHILNKNSLTCPYETADGLCKIRLKYGEDYLCEVCSLYPKLIYNYKYHTEEFLDISCPEISRLLLDCDMHQLLVECDEESTAEEYGTNDDPVYLDMLGKLRNIITEYIVNNEMDYETTTGALLSLAGSVQKRFFDERCEYVSEDLSEDILRNASKMLASYDGTEAENHYSNLYKTIDEIINNGLYHIKLKETAPLTYELCKLYFKRFKHLSTAKASELIKEIFGIGMSTCNDAEKLNYDCINADIESAVRRYLCYRIAQELPTAYEDFSFVRKISIPVMESRFLWLFLYLYEEEHGELNKDNTCNIMSALSRRISHRRNASDNLFLDSYYNLIEPFV